MASMPDGGGLILRVSEASSVWVFRYTAPSGKRREMGLGVAHRSKAAQAGQSITGARDQAATARALLQQGIDPIDERARLKEDAKKAACDERDKRAVEAVTLARAARDYHERVIAPTRTDKHAAQWLSSLENHVPAAIWHRPIGQIRPCQLLKAWADFLYEASSVRRLRQAASDANDGEMSPGRAAHAAGHR